MAKQQFITKKDFDRYITEENLDNIVVNDNQVWIVTLASVIEVVSSYLRFRYDTDKVFDIFEHVLADAYLEGQSVISDGLIYLALSDIPANTPITNTTFWKQSDTRNQAIVDIMVVIVLYGVYSRINGSEIPSWIQIMYDGGDSRQQAGKLGYLKEIRKGTVEINLPLLPAVADQTDKSGNNISGGYAVETVQRNTSI